MRITDSLEMAGACFAVAAFLPLCPFSALQAKLTTHQPTVATNMFQLQRIISMQWSTATTTIEASW